MVTRTRSYAARPLSIRLAPEQLHALQQLARRLSVEHDRFVSVSGLVRSAVEEKYLERAMEDSEE